MTRRSDRAFPVAALAVALVWGTAATSACLEPIGYDTVQRFADQPDALLKQSPQTDAELIYAVRRLAVSSIAALRGIEKIAPKATLKQKEDIAEGLARANGACISRSGEIAHRIDDTVRRLADRDITRVYVRFLTSDDTPAPPEEPPTPPAKSKLGFGKDVSLPPGAALPVPTPKSTDFLKGR